MDGSKASLGAGLATQEDSGRPWGLQKPVGKGGGRRAVQGEGAAPGEEAPCRAVPKPT